MPAEQWILLAFLLTATENFQLTAGRLNAAGVGMKFSASATADWYLAFFQWSESPKVEPEEVAFFSDPSCQSLCTLEVCLKASYILFFCLPPPSWSYEEFSGPSQFICSYQVSTGWNWNRFQPGKVGKSTRDFTQFCFEGVWERARKWGEFPAIIAYWIVALLVTSSGTSIT